MTVLRRKDLVYPELSYKLIGILFDVYNELGSSYQERYYQRALVVAFKDNNIEFKQQVKVPFEYRGSKIGKYYLDFLIDDKIVLEIKRGDYFPKTNIQQINAYLKATNLQLGILANFTNTGIKFRRILNLEDSYIRKNS